MIRNISINLFKNISRHLKIKFVRKRIFSGFCRGFINLGARCSFKKSEEYECGGVSMWEKIIRILSYKRLILNLLFH